jgi:serine protease Do
LFNLEGKLIGINTLKLVDSTIEGMGFAIPINIIRKLVFEYLVPGQAIVRP